MAQIIAVGSNGGRVIFGSMRATKTKTAKTKTADARWTIRLAGSFVEYEPNAKTPKTNEDGTARLASSTVLDADETSAVLAFAGAKTLDDPGVASILDSINAAAAAGVPFAVRLPATARSIAGSIDPKTIIAAAAAFDPTATDTSEDAD